jgi:hypothetical protein
MAATNQVKRLVNGDIAPGVFRAFYWTASSGLTQLGTFGGRNRYAAGIND